MRIMTLERSRIEDEFKSVIKRLQTVDMESLERVPDHLFHEKAKVLLRLADDLDGLTELPLREAKEAILGQIEHLDRDAREELRAELVAEFRVGEISEELIGGTVEDMCGPLYRIKSAFATTLYDKKVLAEASSAMQLWKKMVDAYLSLRSAVNDAELDAEAASS